jgi:hypothetical protein
MLLIPHSDKAPLVATTARFVVTPRRAESAAETQLGCFHLMPVPLHIIIFAETRHYIAFHASPQASTIASRQIAL